MHVWQASWVPYLNRAALRDEHVFSYKDTWYGPIRSTRSIWPVGTPKLPNVNSIHILEHTYPITQHHFKGCIFLMPISVSLTHFWLHAILICGRSRYSYGLSEEKKGVDISDRNRTPNVAGNKEITIYQPNVHQSRPHTYYLKVFQFQLMPIYLRPAESSG